MAKLNLDKEKEKLEKTKQKIKKKHPIVYLAIFLLWTLIVFYAGNFFENSYFVKNTNPFKKIFGQTIVDITEYYNPEINDNFTKINFEITNIGDKVIEDLQLYYSFCGLEEKKASLNKLKLRVEDSDIFSIIIPFRLNLSCSVLAEVSTDVYKDNNNQCYLDIQDRILNMCNYCKINFEVYGNNKKIKHSPIWYPYFEAPINIGGIMRSILVMYPLTLTWKDDSRTTCKVLKPNSPKTNLKKKESLFSIPIDTTTMCLRGEEVEWCKNNFYGKK